MDAAELRPLAIGELLDLAIRIYRARFASLVKAVAVVVAPVSVLGALVQVSASPDANNLVRTPGDTAPDTLGDLGDFWAFLAGILVVGLLTFVASQLATAASLRIVSGAYLDEEPEWRESLRFAVSKLRSLLWLAVVFAVLLGLATLACIVPGIYFYVAWAVAVPVLLIEDVRGRRALKRSRALVRGRWWSTAAVVVLSLILAAIVQAALSGLLLGVLARGGNDVVDAVAGAVANTAASALTTPFTAAVIAAVYFDLRVRKEGFDLELLARRVGVEPPAGAGPGGILPPPPRPAGDEPPYWPPPPGWPPPDA
jgi:hypothetical protein